MPILLAAGAVYAQPAGAPWDTSGNGKLTGTYYFRQVVYSVGDSSGDLGDADTIYGVITFDGNGGYTISSAGANGGAVLIDAAQETSQALPATPGTYALNAAGYGYISSPGGNGDTVFGLLSANNIFVGSSTDNVNGYNDVFIAAKIASPVPTASTFAGAWTFSDFDPDILNGLQAQSMFNMIFTASPDSNGHFNVGPIKGYVNGSASPYTQTSTGLPYIFSNGAAVVTFPSNGTLIYGQKYFYFSPDGNFAFGGAPNGFDMIVAVKTTTAPALSGLYYQVGLDANQGDIDTYFGSVDFIAGAAPQTLLGHQRINDFGGAVNEQYGAALYDYTYTNPFSLSGNSYSTSTTAFVAGGGGNVVISTGLGGALGFSVAVQAPTPTGTGVYLNPQGVVNAASFAPFTARIAPGELITLFGSNLASAPLAITGGNPATSSLGNVTVNIGGYPAPVFSVSPTQVSVIVPYEVTPGSVVGIQLTNGTATSNTVTQIVSNTAPGVFTQCACGIGYGWIDHLGIGNSSATPGAPVSDNNPAVEGETLAVGLTGLGTVSPSITDGAVPQGQYTTTNTIGVDISGTAATSNFAGLLPGLAGEYQLNVTIPATGIAAGPNYLDVEGFGPDGYPDSYMSYLLMPVQATPPSTASSATNARIVTAPPRLFHSRQSGPAVRIPVKKFFARPSAGTANE
ncbi:MAG TPA: IPT/TIG domain-containing protein [Bryobacteraceae bacterium]|nr:IPT/TIG domain-containing protein [Bryobacteraceae bacterium]